MTFGTEKSAAEMGERIAMRASYSPVVMRRLARDVPGAGARAGAGGAPAAHRHPAGLAKLRIFGLHAGRDLRHVRDGIAAQPERVGRARLLLLRAALSHSASEIGAIEAENNNPGQKRQPAYNTNDPHIHGPRLLRKTPRSRRRYRRRNAPSKAGPTNYCMSSRRPRDGWQVPAERWRKYDPEIAIVSRTGPDARPAWPSMRDPGKAAGLVAELIPRHVVRARHHGSFNHLGGEIVE